MAFRCLRRLASFWLVPAALACGSDDAASEFSNGGGSGASGAAGTSGATLSSSEAAAAVPYAPCSAETAVGEFALELAADYTSLEGKVFDSVDPALVPAELARDGSCRLLTPPNHLCDPGCAASTQVCGANNQCLPVPMSRDVGSVSVSGLARAVEMTPNANTGSYRAQPALPHPGFQPGADLRLSSSGADAPFELRGWGIGVLELPPAITVTQGQPVELRWTAPASPGPSHLFVRLDVNNHGSTEASIECDFEDTGEASIPASLVDGLIAQGTSGFPSILLQRRTASSASIGPGCVQFLVSSTLEVDVSVSGLTSCDTDAECPDGQLCKPIERFCE